MAKGFCLMRIKFTFHVGPHSSVSYETYYPLIVCRFGRVTNNAPHDIIDRHIINKLKESYNED